MAEPGSAASHEHFMRLALTEARRGREAGEVPVGAVLVGKGVVVASACNAPISSQDPTAHAEIIALREGGRALGNYRLTGTTLYVTLEPCLMCVGALVSARVASLVYGAPEPKWGAVRSLLALDDLKLNHRVEAIGGVLEEECRGLIQDFFRFRRGEGVG
jgi:tRNA(adenine34) deaminase